MAPGNLELSFWWQYVEQMLWAFMTYLQAIIQVIAEHAREFLIVLLGTFVGAYVAFELERRARERQRLDSRAAEGNLALFTLVQMWEVLNQYKKDVIDKAPNDHGKWLNMPTTLPQSRESLAFDPAKLYFLFEGRNTNLLPQLVLEQRRFHMAVSMINERSELMLKTIWPRLSAAGIELGKQCDEKVVHQVVGTNNFIVARNLADSIVENVSEDVTSFRQTFEKLRTQLRELLPGRKFIKVDFRDSDEGTSSSHTKSG